MTPNGAKPAQPLYTQDEIERVKAHVLSREDDLAARDYLLLVLGMNSFLRGCDLVRLKVGDIVNKEDVRITTSKTGKVAEFYVNDAIRSAFSRYMAAYPWAKEEGYLFFSTFGGGMPRPQHHLTAPAIGRRIRTWCRAVGLTGSFGSHTPRKTGATQWYRAGQSIEVIQAKLTHSSQSTAATRAYLGITRSSIREKEAAINL